MVIFCLLLLQTVQCLHIDEGDEWRACLGDASAASAKLCKVMGILMFSVLKCMHAVLDCFCGFFFFVVFFFLLNCLNTKC